MAFNQRLSNLSRVQRARKKGSEKREVLLVSFWKVARFVFAIINGGVKKTRTYDEDGELRGFVVTLQNFDKLIKEGVKDGTITISENEIETDKTFDI